ncbi:sensor histidine kinase [Fulvivirga imtechensis]|uniref:sensor histidine kinase n=1 Tax=Fulvivirga imtechensis TaxID=881893 RepID=UPI000687FD68|nr:sensor histidine kinase [Fulvivirga imtechensis]
MITFPKEKAFWVRQGKDLLVIFFLSLPFAYIVCQSCIHDTDRFLKLIVINFCVWAILWKGNEATNNLVDKYYSWLQHPGKRLIAGVLAHAVFTAIAITGIFYFFKFVWDIHLGSFQWTLLISIIVTMAISLVLHSISFLKSWRTLAVESERMKKEVISSKYESLKNQVNPHFLFNSLNALSNLVYEDQDQAVKFIKKLSDVYRYVLESRDKDLVELSTELKFAESYLFLQKIRYGESLITSIDVRNTDHYNIPPLALQMLLENAIKHNVISADEPLHMSLYLEDGYLMVVNNLQKKNIIKGESSEIGLSNIKERYSFLTDRPVTISNKNQNFAVGLPLLK